MSVANTTSKIIIDSKRLGCSYIISKFLSYTADMDLDTDTDAFTFTFANPNGIYTGIASKFDEISIHINDRKIICGDIDTVKTKWSVPDGSTVEVSGRDRAHMLIDNDALPGTLLNVEPVRYIKHVCDSYGIAFHSSFGSLPVTKKLEIGSGESEISICNNLADNLNHKIWYVYDTLYLGDFSYSANPVYKFTRGVPANMQGIQILESTLTDDGTDTKSEVLIYGSMNNGKSKVLGTAKNQTMINMGIKRRKVEWSSNNDSVTKYSSSALRKVKDGFRDNIVLEVKVKTDGNIIIYPNATAQVIDTILKINSVFLIKSVTYEKNINGSFSTVKMVPGDNTFNNLWAGQGNKTNGGITGIPTDTASKIIYTRR